jgi:hypothetical protein
VAQGTARTSELRQSKRARTSGKLLAKNLGCNLLNVEGPAHGRPMQLDLGIGPGKGDVEDQRGLIDANKNKGKRPQPLKRS